MSEDFNWNLIISVFGFLGFGNFIGFLYLYNKLTKINTAHKLSTPEKELANYLYIPASPNFLAAAIGSGLQILLYSYLLLLLFVFEIFSSRFYVVSGLILFIFTCFSGGYTSGLIYQYFNQKNWLKNTFLTHFMFFGFSILFAIILSFFNDSSPLRSRLVLLLVLITIISLPITFYGSIAGRNNSIVCIELYSSSCNDSNYIKKTIFEKLHIIYIPVVLTYLQAYFINNIDFSESPSSFYLLAFICLTLSLSNIILLRLYDTYEIIVSQKLVDS